MALFKPMSALTERLYHKFDKDKDLQREFLEGLEKLYPLREILEYAGQRTPSTWTNWLQGKYTVPRTVINRLIESGMIQPQMELAVAPTGKMPSVRKKSMIKPPPAPAATQAKSDKELMPNLRIYFDSVKELFDIDFTWDNEHQVYRARHRSDQDAPEYCGPCLHSFSDIKAFVEGFRYAKSLFGPKRKVTLVMDGDQS